VDPIKDLVENMLWRELLGSVAVEALVMPALAMLAPTMLAPTIKSRQSSYYVVYVVVID
jgi:hypothetical protein